MTERDRTDRRTFLKLATLGLAGGAAGLAAGTGEGEAAAMPEGESEALYRESAHVRRYYAAARF